MRNRDHSETMGYRNVKKIAILQDDRISPTHLKILTTKVNAIRRFIQVDLLQTQLKEPAIIEKQKEHQYDLILVPWNLYTTFTKLDGFLGRTRGKGPTIGGYVCEPVLISKFLDPNQLLRLIIFDFFSLSGSEIAKIISLVVNDQKRNGIKGFLDADSKIYYEEWRNDTGYGQRTDIILDLPDVVQNDWSSRANDIRIALLALWSFIYEEGPGKGGMNRAISPNQKRGYFQVSSAKEILVMRLCFERSNWKSKDAVMDFWPRIDEPSRAAQLLIRYTDFVRVQTVVNHSGAEIVVAFFGSAPAKRTPLHIHNLWIEPISNELIKEMPYEQAKPENKYLIPLPTKSNEVMPTPLVDDSLKVKDKMIQELSKKVREAQLEGANKERMIRELKMGGVGTATPLPPPDGDALLSAFHERFIENHERIVRVESELEHLKEMDQVSMEITRTEKLLKSLLENESRWIRKLASTIQIYRNATTSDSSKGTSQDSKKKRVA